MKYRVAVKFHKDFVAMEGNTITVGVRARPEKGKANEELLRKIARHLGTSASRLHIRSGLRSKNKIIEII